MELVKRYGSFHDWYLLGVNADLDAGEVELRLMFDNRTDRARAIFKGASRCLVNGFLIQNIIYSTKVLMDYSADDYGQALDALDQSYPWGRNKPRKNIAVITASLGAELLIEFDSLEIESVSR
jgi:hypothetical protein